MERSEKWKNYILASGFTIFCIIGSQAQSTYQISGKSLLELKQEQVSELLLFSTHSRLLPLSFTNTIPQNLTQKIQALSLSETYWEELGFFCKMEIKMEQKSRFPVKFRLGTVDYVDRLEGKYE
ncbi:MAG: hypothetical protein AAF806_03860 [Bacteroidota bacterium]